MSMLIILLMLVPITGASLFVSGIIPAVFKGKRVNFFAVFWSAATLVLALVIVYFTFGKGPRSFNWGSLPWIKGTASLFGALIDPLSTLMLIVVLVIGVIVVMFSTQYLSPENKEHPTGKRKETYFFWLLLFIASMIGVAISPNLFQFLIFWELTTICSAALIAFYETEKGYKAGFKALIMTYAPSLFFIIAVALVFVHTKSFGFDAIKLLDPTIKTIVVSCLFIAALAKSAQVPFYTWLPDAMEAPTPVSAYLHAAAMVKAGVFLMARVVVSTAPASYNVSLVMVIFAVVTMYVGLLFYFRQDDLKKLLAFSTITHLAYIFLGLGLGLMGSFTGLKGGLLHIICHAFGKTILFLCVGVIGYVTGTRYISKLSGLAKAMPVVAFSFWVGIFSVTGIPPFSCFWSKFFLLVGSIELKNPLGVILVVLVLMESVGSFFWFLRIGQKIFFGESRTTGKIPVPAVFQWILVILVILAIAAPFFGFALLKGIG